MSATIFPCLTTPETLSRSVFPPALQDKANSQTKMGGQAQLYVRMLLILQWNDLGKVPTPFEVLHVSRNSCRIVQQSNSGARPDAASLHRADGMRCDRRGMVPLLLFDPWVSRLAISQKCVGS